VRRTLLGPEPSEGPVKSATEISVADRNRLWAMNGEYNRIMAELLAKIINRGVFILQKKGLMPKFKINGRQVAVKYTSPFAKTQNADDILALQNTLQVLAPLGPQSLNMGLKVKDIPAYVARKNGVPEDLIMTDADRAELVKQTQSVMQQGQQQQVQQAGAMAAAQAPNTTNNPGLPPPSPPQ
jgi:hypothetical protein